MAIILNIDTAVETASVCLSENEKSLALLVNNQQKDHASWLHPAIKKLLDYNNTTLNDIDAIAVTIGPGSYTGLRIGLSAAKGLCYALGKPLVSVNTLELMAYSVDKKPGELICPAIDARRMEIFTALYDENMIEIIAPTAMIIAPNSFMTILENKRIVFIGNAVDKLEKEIVHVNASFNKSSANASHMAPLSAQRLAFKKFDNLAYTEPFYIKEFYTPAR